MARGRPFEKGNPGGPGRPKIAEEFRKRAQQACDEHVIQAWVEEVESRGPNWVKASELLAAYGLGKPAQAVEVSAPGGDALSIAVTFKAPEGKGK